MNVIDYIIDNENKFKNIQIINIGSDITLSILQAANIIKKFIINYIIINYRLIIISKMIQMMISTMISVC